MSLEYADRVGEISIMALKAQYEELFKNSKPGNEDINKVLFDTVDGYIRILDNLNAYYSALETILKNNKEVLKIANEIATAELVIARITNSPALDQRKLEKELKREIKEGQVLRDDIYNYALDGIIKKKDLDGKSFNSFRDSKRSNGRYF